MNTLSIDLGPRSYDIHIGPGLLDEAGHRCKAVLPRAKTLAVVTDSNVGPLYGGRLVNSLEGAGFAVTLITIPAGETSKSLTQLGRLYDEMLAAGLSRTDAVVALGGGVVGDLAGLAAATLLRGVDFVQIPTTLLAQVDSSVGGKVAIDVEAGKNLVGAFWQPKLVLMDPNTLETLSDGTFSDGMAEVIKYGCIQDAGLFTALVAAPTRCGVMANIEAILHRCCDLKRQVVEADEQDVGVRMILNFGHTLGHAYERAGHYETWTHGQAVAAGMVLAAQLGVTLGITDPGVPGQIAGLLSAFDLPTQIACTLADYTAAVGLDKKGSGSDITLVLLKELGTATLYKIKKEEVLGML